MIKINRPAGAAKNFKNQRSIWMGIILIFLNLSWALPDDQYLAQTKWEGVMNIPSPQDCILEFSKTTFNIDFQDEVVETMSYKISGDTLTLKKLSGSSPCNTEVGQYKYLIANKKLTITLLKDDCTGRAQAFVKEGYSQMEK